MGVTVCSSEDSIFGDKDYLGTSSLPFATQPKACGGRKRAFFATATFVSFLFLASYLAIQYWASDRFGADLELIPFDLEDVELPSNTTYPAASLLTGVRGPPTPLFKGARLSAIAMEFFDSPNIDNLLPDVQYLTSWPSAGWSESHRFPRPLVPCSSLARSERRYGLRKSTPVTLPTLIPTAMLISNQGNLIYLALITDRIPVIPKFTPSHVLVDGRTGDLPFGDVFDVPRLASLIRSPVLEWRDVKIDDPPVVETMGCWAVWPEQQQSDPTPRQGHYPRHAGLGGFHFLPCSPFIAHSIPYTVQTFHIPSLLAG